MDAESAKVLLSRAEDLSPKLRGPDTATALAELQDAHPDLLEALELFIVQRQTDEALRMGIALYRLWLTQKGFEEGERWFDKALALPGGDRRLRGEASVLAGFMPFWQGKDA